MKKILIALMVLGLAAASASAGVGINWSSTAGYTHANDSTPILDDYSVVWQLIYSADNVMDAPDLDNGANGWVSLTGDDDVWATRNVAQGGGFDGDGNEWDNYLTLVTGSAVYENLGWTTAGWVYQRVFENSPTNGTWYYEGGLVALNTAYTGAPQFPTDSLIASESEPFHPDQQFPAVPEPVTMSLLGLGALALAIRRRS